MFYIMLIYFFIGVKSQNFLREASLNISICQLKDSLISETNFYEDIRMKLINDSMLNIFNLFDTLIFIETYDLVGGTFIGEIWDGVNKSLTYTFHNGKFVFNEPSVFTNYTKQLIKKWDVESIKFEEKANVTISPYTILGSRIVRVNNSIKVDCIKFKEFFSLERDR